MMRLTDSWFFITKAVQDLGTALEEAKSDPGKIPAVFAAIGEVGETCSKCHKDNTPAVWNRYIWKDFNSVMINTPEGPLPWAEAKMKYMAAGFDGIGVNIKQGNQAGAAQSLGLFKTMFNNMRDSCSSCHSSERRYYVSGDIQAMISDMEANITNGDLTEAGEIRQGIGIESCYKCHVLHIPAQYAKVSQK
ncbi:hypothetical protein ANME2D_01877 [Candidatus Methanoperedens nitroreducens]|uniref:Uncharacterized protein n=1 Tax=Candidatus Methanoperedens nitratireducens TaxID=1392998 RepID=A0A062V395_9EURY|nr:hypothetical protein [Candidatus Methanoperedens nitroreducens]KCZ71822.1 hypothetical protein ANME2D_01877 [Candidatus Methanoperedens nitroreducens]MDJ1422204.1 hypothetical protein [Candidatus Methanoperedens sp.]